jgi:hypothetical protein
MRRSIGPLTGNDEGEINRILSREGEILPSSGFTISVMDAVRREAIAQPPIPFPWKRALPGLLVGGVVLALVLVAIIRAIAQVDRTSASRFSTSLPSAMPPIFSGGLESAAIWAALALLTAFVSVRFTMRLSGQE